MAEQAQESLSLILRPPPCKSQSRYAKSSGKVKTESHHLSLSWRAVGFLRTGWDACNFSLSFEEGGTLLSCENGSVFRRKQNALVWTAQHSDCTETL